MSSTRNLISSLDLMEKTVRPEGCSPSVPRSAQTSSTLTKTQAVFERKTSLLKEEGPSGAKAVYHAYDVIGDIAGAGRAALEIGEYSAALATSDATTQSTLLGMDTGLTASSLYSFLLYAPVYGIKLQHNYEEIAATARERGIMYAASKHGDAWLGWNASCAAMSTAWAVQRSLLLTSSIAKTAHNTSVVNSVAPHLTAAGHAAMVITIVPFSILAYRMGKELHRAQSLKNRISATIKLAQENESPIAYSKAVRILEEARTTSFDEVMKDFSNPDQDLRRLYIERRVNQAIDSYKKCNIDAIKDPTILAEIKKRQSWSKSEWRAEIERISDTLDIQLKETKDKLLEEYGLTSLPDDEKKQLLALTPSAIQGYVIAYQEKAMSKEASLEELIGSEAMALVKTASSSEAVCSQALGMNTKEIEAKNEKVVKAALNALSLNPFNRDSNQTSKILFCVASTLMVVSSALYLGDPLICGLIASILWLISNVIFTYLDYKAYQASALKAEASINSKEVLVRNLIRWAWATLSICMAVFAILCIFNHYTLPVILTFAAIYLVLVILNLYVFKNEKFAAFNDKSVRYIASFLGKKSETPSESTLIREGLTPSNLAASASSIASSLAKDPVLSLQNKSASYVVRENIDKPYVQNLIRDQFKIRHATLLLNSQYKGSCKEMLKLLNNKELEAIKNAFLAHLKGSSSHSAPADLTTTFA